MRDELEERREEYTEYSRVLHRTSVIEYSVDKMKWSAVRWV